MNLSEFHKNRQFFESQQEKFRNLCPRCLQPEFGCYCREIKPIDPKMRIVILIHPIQARRRIATGRMSLVKNSRLIRGQNYTENDEINTILKRSRQSESDPLSRKKNSVNLSDPENIHRAVWYDRKKTLNLFVIDGTWATARQMLRQSQNLSELPRVSFTPTKLSQFRVRKQPAPQNALQPLRPSISRLSFWVRWWDSTSGSEAMIAF